MIKLSPKTFSETFEQKVILTDQESKNLNARKIQTFWRGYWARVCTKKEQRCSLSYSELEKAKFYIDTPGKLEGVPLASTGKTTVYLPQEIPIVLKQSGSPDNQRRLNKMIEGRGICESSRYNCLVIPKARVYGNFIVESRLPITVQGTKEQIGLYIENKARFNSAVKEFTGFLCQSSFFDIIGGNHDPYATLSKSPLGRYDNIALYLEEEQGKIGLIDLELFCPRCSKTEKKWCYFKCATTLYLFPYHLEEILSAAKEFDPDIEIYREDLEKERDEALKRFKIAYEDHLDFVRKKGITLDDPIAFEKLEEARLEELKKVIKATLLKESDNNLFKECLGDNPEEMVLSFNEKALPVILDAIYQLINDLLDFNLKSKEGGVTSRVHLLSVRTLNFDTDYIVYEKFIEATINSVKMFNFKNSFKAKEFMGIILDLILKELEGEEIAYYNPSFGYGKHATKCIFC